MDQILKGVSFMHEKFIFCRDIKPENCMVNKDTFGSARQTMAQTIIKRNILEQHQNQQL
jgi:serine/threonine protein kinase